MHIRSACPPILYGCKYLNFSRSTSENELISRQSIQSLESADEEKFIRDYADFGSKRYRNMVEVIRKHLNLTTLEYHSLDGLLGSIGINKRRLCSYCWTGDE